MKQVYETIGVEYASARRADPCIESLIWAALGSARTFVNVGAGTGNYEPTDRWAGTVESVATMLVRRRVSTVSARGCTERRGRRTFDVTPDRGKRYRRIKGATVGKPYRERCSALHYSLARMKARRIVLNSSGLKLVRSMGAPRTSSTKVRNEMRASESSTPTAKRSVSTSNEWARLPATERNRASARSSNSSWDIKLGVPLLVN